MDARWGQPNFGERSKLGHMADNHDDTMGQYRIQLVPSYGQFMT